MPKRAIQRQGHPSPTVNDLIHELNGGKVFSQLELRFRYHRLSLANESRYITRIVTDKGLRRYTKLNFDSNSASELFQNVINNQVHDISGVIHISDDLIMHGKSQEDHGKPHHAECQGLLKSVLP